MKRLQINARNTDRVIHLIKTTEMTTMSDQATTKAKTIIIIIDQTTTTTAMKHKMKEATRPKVRIRTTGVISRKTTSTNGNMISQNKKTKRNPKHNKTPTTVRHI